MTKSRWIASSSRLRLPWLAAAALGLTFIPESGFAQPVSDSERAQQLFDEALVLMQQKRYAEACPKLAESQTRDPGGGTILNLGICRYREGRTATAQAVLQQALAQAEADGRQDRRKTAQKYLDLLAPVLSRLTVKVPDTAAISGLIVKIDGTLLNASEYGVAVPFDPGGHEVAASAEGRKPWSRSLNLGAEADAQIVEIPVLEPEPVAPTPAPPPANAPSSKPTPPPEPFPASTPPRQLPGADSSGPPRWLGYATLGLGVAGLGVGTYFGVRSLSEKGASDRYWDGRNCTQQSCVDDWDDAKTSADISTVALGVGVAAVGAGVFLVLNARDKEQPVSAVSVSLQANPSGGALSGRANF